MRDLVIYVDESGNLGHGKGRFFTIACVVMDKSENKSIHRKMKRICLRVKNNNPDKKWPRGEVKASLLRMKQRADIIKHFPKDKIKVYSITIDKTKLQPKMFEDKAISYNYWLRLVIDNVLDDYPECKSLSINIDKRDIKVFSGNSFEDYLKIHLLFVRESDAELHINYPESHNDYGVQIADFFSNGINYDFLSNRDDKVILCEAIEPYCKKKELFPRRYFGK